MTDIAPPRAPPRGSLRAWILALLAPILVVGLAGALVVATTASGEGDRPGSDHPGVGLAAEPLELTSVSSDVAGHYTYARDHQAAYSEIPCYCGCEEFLDHRNLYDCFVRSDGQGWDAHAAGCGVCIGESTAARELLEQGQDPSAARDAVIAQFGATPTTAPPGA